MIDSLKGGAQDQKNTQREKEDHINMQVHQCIVHDNRIIGSCQCINQWLSSDQDNNQEDDGPQKTHHGRLADSFSDSLDLTGTKVLAGKGGVSTGNACQWHICDHDDSSGSSMCCNDRGSKSVDGSLKDNGTNGKNRIHKSHGKTG